MIPIKIIISNANGQPIYDQIYSQSKGASITGELPGRQLSSIRGLAKDLRISVITTKRAYDELERDGFINTVAGKGCFVAEKNIELIREEHLKKIEACLLEAVSLADASGISRQELMEMFQLFIKEE